MSRLVDHLLLGVLAVLLASCYDETQARAPASWWDPSTKPVLLTKTVEFGSARTKVPIRFRLDTDGTWTYEWGHAEKWRVLEGRWEHAGGNNWTLIPSDGRSALAPGQFDNPNAPRWPRVILAKLSLPGSKRIRSRDWLIPMIDLKSGRLTSGVATIPEHSAR